MEFGRLLQRRKRGHVFAGSVRIWPAAFPAPEHGQIRAEFRGSILAVFPAPETWADASRKLV
eukprot:4778013-Lingulodinium_polyedra.AAC.1